MHLTELGPSPALTAGGRIAREFDQISRESGRDWPGVRFLEWLRDEWAVPLGVVEIEASA
jgi:hypothetical protein